MGLVAYVRGWVSMEIRGTVPESVLNACAARNIEFWSVRKPDAFTIRMKVRRKQADTVAALALRCQCQVSSARQCGVPVVFRGLRRRYALLLGAVVCTALLAVSSAFVWNIRVVGNEELTTGQILRALERCGVEVGSFWPAFSADGIRNDLLLQMPELRWAAVNYDSSTVTVIVREKREKPEMVYEDIPTHVVAEKPGLITRMSVLRGEPLTGRGQTVPEGEMLISGAVPSTLAPTRLEHALGRVEARTWYTIRADLPLEQMKKTYTGRQTHRFSLVFGENRINFYGNSGIYEGNCDKIIEEYPLSVEGVFTLPISVVRETFREYALSPYSPEPEGLQQEMERALNVYLKTLIGEDGVVTASTVCFSTREGVLRATLYGECLENIAREVPMTPEEIESVRLENAAREETADD